MVPEDRVLASMACPWCGSQVEREDLQDYLNDFNACFDAEKRVGLHDKANLELRIDWVNALREIVGRRMPTNKLGKPVTSDIDLLMAETSERIEALLVAKKLWPKTPKKKIS